jgi:hypothetical protein
VQPAHPARYNEIHSPDTFEVLPPKQRTETVRCVAVVAQDHLFGGDKEELQAEIRPPARPSRWHVLSHRKQIGPATAASTVLLDEDTPLADRVRVHARVQAGSLPGQSGRYFAIHRVGWRGLTPPLHGAISANGAILLGAADADGNTMTRTALGSAWFQVQGGRVAPAAHVTAVSRAPGYFDAFVAGLDGQVYTAATPGSGWGGWWRIPGTSVPQGARIDPVSRTANRLDVFCADTAGHIVTAAWQPGFAAWTGWTWIRGGVTAPGGAVTGVSRRPDFLDVFTVGTDGRVYTAAWDPSSPQWKGWWAIGSDHTAVGAPATCISRSLDNLDVFVADGQGRVLTAHWSPSLGNSWQGWTQVLGGVTGPGATIAAASRRPDYLDVFIVGTDGRIYTASWQPASGWGGWWVLPGVHTAVGTPLVALSPAADTLLVTTSAGAGHLVANTWQPATGWVGWSMID